MKGRARASFAIEIAATAEHDLADGWIKTTLVGLVF